ncbi:MAG: hypothetical protein O7H41_06160 [Planctomycetota bacterium]|nr:hypothetical protein [Planctomycetota bacterium]
MEKRIALLLLAFLLSPLSAQAGELLNQFDRPRRDRKSDDRRQWHGVTFFNAFGLSGGIWNAVIDSEIRIDKANVIGSPVDFGPNLGIESTQPLFVGKTFFGYEWKEGRALRIETSYFWGRYEGSEQTVAGDEFVLDGWTFSDGTAWDSKVDILQGKTTLRFTPWIIDLGLVQIRPSFYGGGVYMQWTLRLDVTTQPATGDIGDNGNVKDRYHAAMGFVGGHLEVRVGPVWAYVWAGGLQFKRNELAAQYFEAGGGLKFEILPFLVANAEFSYIEANLDRNDQFRTNFQMYGPSVFLVLKY